MIWLGGAALVLLGFGLGMFCCAVQQILTAERRYRLNAAEARREMRRQLGPGRGWLLDKLTEMSTEFRPGEQAVSLLVHLQWRDERDSIRVRAEQHDAPERTVIMRVPAEHGKSTGRLFTVRIPSPAEWTDGEP